MFLGHQCEGILLFGYLFLGLQLSNFSLDFNANYDLGGGDVGGDSDFGGGF